MNLPNECMIIELFASRESAEKAYHFAIKQGYKDSDINIIMSDEFKKEYYDSLLAERERIKTSEDLTLGGATGAAIGGVLAAIAAVGTNFAVPGLGLVIAGPLAGAGLIAGGLVGTLVGLGLSKEHAELYEQQVRSGGILLCVKEKHPHSTLQADWKQFKE